MNTYALTPDTDGSTKVTVVPNNLERVRLHVAQPFSLSRWDGPAYQMAPEPITLDVQRFGRQRILHRRERRQLARAHGRRRAVAVPWLTEWEARIAAHPSIPPGEVQRFAAEHAEIVRREFGRRR